MRVRALVFLALALTLTVVTAQDRQRSERPRRIKYELDIEVEEAALDWVVEKIARQTGKTILVDPAVSETVTVNLRKVSWRVALDVIARLTSCKVEQLPSGVIILTQPPKVSLQFTDANVRTVLLLLAAYSGKSIVISPDVRGAVTLDLRNVEWVSAMHAVAKTAGNYAILGASDLMEVRPGGWGALPSAPPVAKSLVGTLVSSTDSTLELKTPAGKEVSLHLTQDSKVHSRLVAVLDKLRKGDRLVVTYELKGKRQVVTNLIAQGR